MTSPAADELAALGWPRRMVEDLLGDVLTYYYADDANAAQDLLLLGFSAYMACPPASASAPLSTHHPCWARRRDT